MTEHARAGAQPSVTSDAVAPPTLRDRLPRDLDLADVARAIADGHPRAAALYVRIFNEAIAVHLWEQTPDGADARESGKRRGRHHTDWNFQDVLKDLEKHEATHPFPRPLMTAVAEYANKALHFPNNYGRDYLGSLWAEFHSLLEWFEEHHEPVADDLEGFVARVYEELHAPGAAIANRDDVVPGPLSPVVGVRSHGFVRCGDGLHMAASTDHGLSLRPMGTAGSLPVALADAGQGFALSENGSLAATLVSGQLRLAVVGTDPSGQNPVVVDQRVIGAPEGTTLLAASRMGRLAARCLVADGSVVHLWEVTARGKAPLVRQVGDGDVTLGVILDDAATVLSAEGEKGAPGPELRELFPGLDRILSIDRVPVRSHGMVAVLGTDTSGRLRVQVRGEDRSLALDEPVEPRATQVAIARDLGRRYPSTLVAVSTPTDAEVFELEARP